MDKPAFIEVNGVGLRYQLMGRGERTIVLLHEMSSMLEAWDEIAPALAQDATVLRYGARGFGLSEKASPESFDQLADDLRALLQALDLKPPYILVGSAMGGATALVYAARHPDEVEKVVALAPAINMTEAAQAGAAASAPPAVSSMRQILETRIDSLYHPSIRTADRMAKFRAIHLASNGPVTSAVLTMMRQSDLRTVLPQIRCPALIVAAGLYAQRSPEAIKLVADAIPGARFEVLPTDHIMTVQSPELVLPLVQDFLGQ